MEDRQREVAPAALRGRLVHLERVLELEQLLGPHAIVDEPVEGRQQRGPALEAVVQVRRVDAPLALHALDDGGLARLADVDRLHRHRPPLRPRDAERCEPALVPDPLRLLDRGDLDVSRIDALGQVPEPLPPDPAGDRHLTASLHELEHLGDVAVVRPAGRRPRHDTRVRDVAGRERARALQQPEDVPPAAVVVAEPHVHPPLAAPSAGTGEVEAEVAHRPDERVELEQRPILLERSLQVLGPVRRAEAAPGDEVGVRRDRRGGIDLQQRQPLDDLEQIRRARRVEQLRAHRDPPRLLPASADAPRERVGGRARSPPTVRPSTSPGPRARWPELPAPRNRPRSARAPLGRPAGSAP